MNEIDTIIFDFDGTLADTMPSMKRAFWETLNELNIPFPTDVSFDELASRTMDGIFKAVGISGDEMRHAAATVFQERYREIAPERTKLFPGVAETIEMLVWKGFRLAIATNEKRKNLDMHCESLMICGYFHMTICEDETEKPKPSPEMPLRIMKNLNALPERTLFVGDSIYDIMAGKAAGCKTCAFALDGYLNRKLMAFAPDHVVKHFWELADILNLAPTGRKHAMNF